MRFIEVGRRRSTPIVEPHDKRAIRICRSKLTDDIEDKELKPYLATAKNAFAAAFGKNRFGFP